MTYPQMGRMGNAVHDAGDPLLNTWALAWVAHQLPLDPAHLFDANIFYPEQHTLAYSETLLAPAIAVAPLLWLGAGPVFAYNLVFVLGFILSGVGAALLVRHLTRDTHAAVLAGVIFAFCPYRFDHMAQMQLQQAQWIPLALWSFHRLLDTHRVRDGLWLGALVACQVLSCVYYGIFLMAYLMVVGGFLLLANLPRARRSVSALASGVALTTMLLVPAGVAYLGARQTVGERTVAEIRTNSASWRNFLATNSTNTLYGWTADRFGASQRRLFPGLIAVACALVALWPFPAGSPGSMLRVAYTIGLAFAVELTLGLHGSLYPFLYDHLVVFHALRIPALADILVTLSLAVLAGFGLARIGARLHGARARVALTAVLCAGVLVESHSGAMQLTTIPAAPPAIYGDLVQDAGAHDVAVPARIVELPVFREDPTYMYYSTFHWQTLLNGYSGFFPASYVSLYKETLLFPNAVALDDLRSRGARYVLVHGELMDPDEYRRTIDGIDRCECGLTLVARRPWLSHDISLYRLSGAALR